MRVAAALIAGAALLRTGAAESTDDGVPTLLPTLYPSWIPSLGPMPLWDTPEPTYEGAVNKAEKITLATFSNKQRKALEKRIFTHFHDTFIDMGMEEEKVKDWIKNGETAFDSLSAACQKKLRSVAHRMTKKPWGPGIRDMDWAITVIPEKCHKQMKKSVETTTNTIRRRLLWNQQDSRYPPQQDSRYPPQQDNRRQQRDNGLPQQRDNGFKQRDTGFKQRDTGFKERDTGFKQRDTGFKQRDSGFKQQDMGYGQQDKGYGQQNDGYGQGDDDEFGDEDYDDCVIEDEEDKKLCASVIAVCNEVEDKNDGYGKGQDQGYGRVNGYIKRFDAYGSSGYGQGEDTSYGGQQAPRYHPAKRTNPYSRGEIEVPPSSGYSWMTVAAVIASLSGAVAACAILYSKTKEYEEVVEDDSSALLAA